MNYIMFTYKQLIQEICSLLAVSMKNILHFSLTDPDSITLNETSELRKDSQLQK